MVEVAAVVERGVFAPMPGPLLLIVGGESDPQTQRVVDQAHLRDIPYHFWDTDQTNARRIAWDFESPRIDLDGDAIEPTAVFARYNVFAGDPTQNLAVFDTVQSYMLVWPQLRILNRAVMTDANNKARNLRWARDAGLAIPETLVMADLTPLMSVPAGQQRVVKPLAGGAHTRLVSEISGDLNELAALPPQFVQNRLPGVNIRLYLIGNQPFCFRLHTSSLDYREDENVTIEQVEPPAEIIGPARQLVQRIGFDYCALDFRCASGLSDPVFLEINSFPMFVRFDDASGNQLVDAMLQFLVSK